MINNRLAVCALMAAMAATASAENLLSDPYLEAAPLYGSENIGRRGQWIHSVGPKASGQICRTVTSESNDSVMYAGVRYLSSGIDASTTSFSQCISIVSARKYRFTAMVKFLSPEAKLTIAARLNATGRTVSALTLESRSDGDFVPGVWTRAVFDFDLSDVTSADELSSLTLYMMPQADSSLKGVPTPRRAAMMIGATELRALDGVASGVAVTDGGFALWDGLPASPRHWSVAGAAAKTAGRYTFDYAVGADAETSVVSENMNLGNSTRNSLNFMVKTPVDGTIAVSSEKLGQLALLPLKASASWQRLKTSLDYDGEAETDRLTFTLPAGSAIDAISVEPVYGIDNPRPAERTLHVTTSSDNGAGSLRACVAEANPGDLIVFDVEAVTLNDVIALPDKSLSIDGRGATVSVANPGKSNYRIFEISPSESASVLTLGNVSLVGGESSNGAIVYIGDARSTGALSVFFDNVRFTGGKSSASGGAVNITAPNVKALFRGCCFEGCSAATQGGALSVSVAADISGCRFEGNTSALGGAVSVPAGPGVVIENSVFANNISTGARGGALSIATTVATEPTVVSSCSFVGNRSTNASTGAGAIVVNGMTAGALMTNLTLYNNTGASASGIEFYNSARSPQSPSYVVNSTFVSDGAVPELKINATKPTIAPDITLVNNLFYGKGAGQVALNGGSFKGSNNLFTASQTVTSLDGTIICDDAALEIFASYDGGIPVLADDCTLVPATDSPVTGAGISSFKVAATELVPLLDASGNIRPSTPSIGSREATDNDGVGDIAASGPGGISINVYPNPASAIVTVSASTTLRRVSLVTQSGAVAMVSNTPQLDVSWLASGIYVVVAEAEDGTAATSKLIIK